jgi:hypothetical protein
MTQRAGAIRENPSSVQLGGWGGTSCGRPWTMSSISVVFTKNCGSLLVDPRNNSLKMVLVDDGVAFARSPLAYLPQQRRAGGENNLNNLLSGRVNLRGSMSRGGQEVTGMTGHWHDWVILVPKESPVVGRGLRACVMRAQV